MVVNISLFFQGSFWWCLEGTYQGDTDFGVTVDTKSPPPPLAKRPGLLKALHLLEQPAMIHLGRLSQAEFAFFTCPE